MDRTSWFVRDRIINYIDLFAKDKKVMRLVDDTMAERSARARARLIKLAARDRGNTCTIQLVWKNVPVTRGYPSQSINAGRMSATKKKRRKKNEHSDTFARSKRHCANARRERFPCRKARSRKTREEDLPSWQRDPPILPQRETRCKEEA